MRTRWRVLARLAAWSALETGQTFLLGYALARALDGGFLAGDARTGLLWLAAAAAGVVVGAYGTGRVYRAVADLVEPVRDRLVETVVARGVREADDGAVSGLTQQVEIARDALAGLVMVSRSFVFTAAGALVGLLSLAPALLLVVAPPLLAGVLLFALSLRPLARRQEAFLVADEALAREWGAVCPGLRDITATGAEERVARDVGARVDAELAAARSLARWSVPRVAALAVGGQLPIVLLLVSAPWLLARGVTPGALVGALAYVTQSLLPALQNLIHGLGAGGSRLTVVLRRIGPRPGDPTHEPPSDDTGATTTSSSTRPPADTPTPDRPTPQRPSGPHRRPTTQTDRPETSRAPGSHQRPLTIDGSPTDRPETPHVPGAHRRPSTVDGSPTDRPETPHTPGPHRRPITGVDDGDGTGSPARLPVPGPHGKPGTDPGDGTGIPAPAAAPGAHRKPITAPAEGSGTGSPATESPARPEGVPLPRAAHPALSLRGVSFAYGAAATPVLDGLDLVVPDGGHLAVVGASGIGKSTLTALVAGLLTPARGSVLVCGHPVPGARAAALRVLIPQEAYVHTGTLAENLGHLRSDPVPEGELRAAAEAVGLGPLMAALGGPGGRVDPAALSAGERQLVALARAYLSPAPLALLDEATCHLDPEAEARAERAFAARPGGTLVVVAHRISSAYRADRVLVMDGPRTAYGTHEELLRGSAPYRDLVGGWSVPAERS
ncbi:ATP-binding cassette domain-containing protein [Streptomyces sp. NPDC005840]|uniref:ATP-binding cassette domain-containing protein n=1 Tax=Streptomyces sp. NPDC005840 TaxID=3157072 RepID=UPI0033FD4EB4